MKIIRHTARDMRQALRAVREQLGEDAVILSSRRTGEGVEVTAAVDFDASNLEAGGFADTLPAVAPPRTTVPSKALPPPQGITPAPKPTPSYDELAATKSPAAVYHPGYDADWISEAAREAVAEYVAAPRAPVLPPAHASRATQTHPAAQPPHTPAPAVRATRASAVSDAAQHTAAPYQAAAPYQDSAAADPVEAIRAATLTPLASNEARAASAAFQTTGSPAPAATEAMGNELKTLRRMLETQLAHLAWNDLARRAPVHTELLRELTEIGITQDLAEHLVRQLPEDTDLTFARRFTIAGLSQYLKVTGDRWLEDGGRVAFVGATGVGKTTTLAKIAVRWVLRHGPRDIALIGADPVRIGAQDQLRSLAQLLGVPVYTPETFEQLPALLSGLSERVVLIDTPGASVRDTQLTGRMAVLSNSASKLETALVLAASTQAGAIEEAVRRFAPANPSCCVLTKIDEAASLGGVLSALIRARLPVSYMSEGQRVPEDLRPARALELVSAAVRLAKARGAAADEDLLRRRFGKTAHGIS
jgi:flagellar biosynthesis protein FlhF